MQAHGVEAISLLNVPGSKMLADAGGIRVLCDVMRKNAHDADMQVCTEAVMFWKSCVLEALTRSGGA
jgi:hypothetical protein